METLNKLLKAWIIFVVWSGIQGSWNFNEVAFVSTAEARNSPAKNVDEMEWIHKA